MNDHQKLTDAVDRFLWMSGHTEHHDKVESVCFTFTDGKTWSLGTDTFMALRQALHEHRHPESVVRKNDNVPGIERNSAGATP